MAEHVFLVSGMTCAACAARVETALRTVPGVTSASVDLMGHRARVTADTAIATTELIAAAKAEGYGLSPLKSHGAPRVPALTLLDVSTALSFLTALYALFVDFSWVARPHALFIPCVALVVASPLLVRGVREWARLRPGMDGLVTLSAIAATSMSLVGDGPHAGHDSGTTVAHLLAAVMVGKWLEDRARRRALKSFEALVHSLPSEATLPDGRRVDAQDLKIGDEILVAPGERFPTNGTLIAGEALVNEALISGESMPVSKTGGATVWGGTLNLELPARVHVTTRSTDSRAAVMIHAMEVARASKSSLGRWSDSVLSVFVPVLVVLALSAGAWHAREDGLVAGLRTLAATLAVACPCALGLAVPAALSASLGALARQGIVTRDAQSLEIAADIDVVALDKTGTLTERELSVVATETLAGDPLEAIALAASACAGSRHPASIAIVRQAATQGLPVPDATGFIPRGRGGVAARVDGHVVAVGQRSWLALSGIAVQSKEESETEVIIAIDDVPRVRVVLGESLRTGALDAVRLLKERGYELVILSGDRPQPVQSIASSLGIAVARGGLTPEGKAEFISELRRRGNRVAMVGDGLNDGLAFTAADLRIAVGEEADLASTGAHVVIPDESPSKVAVLLRAAKRTRSVMRQNIAMSVIYNLAMTPLAMSGSLSPATCAITMAASSLLVVGNALRLLR